MSFFLAKFTNLLADEHNVCVRWGYHDKKLSIDFSGVPFIQIGYQEYQCHQGKDNIHENKLL